jgi:hypothetical protein
MLGWDGLEPIPLEKSMSFSNKNSEKSMSFSEFV